MPFDISRTIISQYANSPIITGVLANLAQSIDQTANLDQFYRLVWNIDTAQGWGLDVLGRIVGVRRVLRIAAPGTYLGFQQDAAAVPFGFGIWYGLGTSSDNYTLTDDAYRRLILAKAALNITDASIPSINRILMALFTGYGNVYVRDNGGMSMTYVFSAPLSAVDFAIVTQSGVLPKPVGVTAAGESP